ncbi:MAG: outer rane efflux protein [Firmicutes bacterium]|nr:outer rane efflux protein [Bacillota bacterium]
MKHSHRCLSGLLFLLLLFGFQAVSAAPLELSLEASIRMALQTNPVLKMAEAGKEKSVWKEKEARAEKSLSIEFAHTTLRSDVPQSYVAALAPVSPYSYFKNQINASIPIYSGGKLESCIEQADLKQRIAELQIEGRKEQLKLEVTTAYYEILQARNLLEVATRSVRDFTDHLQSVQKQYDTGTVALPDVLQTKVRLANAQDNFIKARNNYDQSIYHFNTIIGLPIHSEIVLVDNLTYQSYTQSLDSCINDALLHRPDMEEDKTVVELTQEQVRGVQSGKRPTMSLNVTNYWDDTKFSGTKNSKWATSLTAKWNVFDSGLTEAKLKQARYEMISAREQARQTRDTITLEVSQSYQNMQEAEKRIETNTVAVEQGEVDFRLAKERYETGFGTNLDVIDAELALIQAKTNYAQAQYDYHIAKAQLDKAMGVSVE